MGEYSATITIQIHERRMIQMKAKRTAAALTAAIITLIPLSGAVSPAAEPAAVYAAEGEGLQKMPGWIPADFDSALEFRNTYGGTHIEDGLLCIVYEQQKSYNDDSDTPRFELMTTEDVMKPVSKKTYAFTQSKRMLEVAVFAPAAEGEFEAAVIDTWAKSGSLDLGYKHAIARYSFSVGAKLDITETDIYGWLPDCLTEYKDFSYSGGEGKVLVKDNYLLFCLQHASGTPYDWTEDSAGHDCLTLETISDCSEFSAISLEGGTISQIYVYRAVKDGYDKISYSLSPLYSSGEVEETVTADCVVFDDASAVLLTGNARATLQDAVTGETIPFGENTMPMIWTDISFNTSEGTMSTGPIYEMNTNPAVLDEFTGWFSADSFSFGLIEYSLPAGYTLPAADMGSCGYFSGKVIPEGFVTVRRFDNGAADVVFRLNQKPESDLEPNETRITLYDKDTGELIPSSVLTNHEWSFGTDIRFEDPNTPGEWIMTGPIVIVEQNPCVIRSDLAELYKSADVFRFCCEDQPEVTYYDNCSMDLVFRTKIKVSGNINGDVQFDIADAVALAKLLMGEDVEIFNWAQGDFDLNDRLTAVDLTLMKRALIKNAATPVGVTMIESGGIAGVYHESRVYAAGGKYFFYYCDSKDANGALTEITEEQYRKVMSVDFWSYPEPDEEEVIYDGFNYSTVVTYADGSQKSSKAIITPLIQLMKHLSHLVTDED